MTAISFYVQIVKALDEINSPYMSGESLEIWNKTLTRAREEIEKGDTPHIW